MAKQAFDIETPQSSNGHHPKGPPSEINMYVPEMIYIHHIPMVRISKKIMTSMSSHIQERRRHCTKWSFFPFKMPKIAFFDFLTSRIRQIHVGAHAKKYLLDRPPRAL